METHHSHIWSGTKDVDSYPCGEAYFKDNEVSDAASGFTRNTHLTFIRPCIPNHSIFVMNDWHIDDGSSFFPEEG